MLLKRGTAEDFSAKHRWSQLPWLILLVLITMTICFAHLNIRRMVEPADFYALQAREPFVYRILLPFLAQGQNFADPACRTGQSAPLAACADALAFLVDFLSLFAASLVILTAFRRIRSANGNRYQYPEAAVPLFLWTVIFNFLIVPNRSLYYPYDFLELLFFSLTACLATYRPVARAALPALTFVAALNKETALFIPAVYLIFVTYIGDVTKVDIVSSVASLAAPFLAKLLGTYYVVELMHHAIGVTPSLYEDHFIGNLRELKTPITWLSWGSAFGGIVLLAPREFWKTRSGVFLAVLAATWVAIIFAVGVVREIRLVAFLAIPLLLPVMEGIDRFISARLVDAGSKRGSAPQTR